MYRIILFTLIFPTLTFALTIDLQKQYADFEKNYAKTLNLTKNPKLFFKDFDTSHKTLKKKYSDFAVLEKSELSPEGNQMALDIEMLEPLEFLASSRISKDSCAEAEALNEMNSTSDPQTFKKIKDSLKTLCK